MKPKILFVYAALNHPLRANTRHLIESFREYGDAHWFYLNLAHKKAPSYVAKVKFDLVIFQTTFTQRLSRNESYYVQMMRRAHSLAELNAPKVALVQDEFWNVEKVERFIRAFKIDTVFSVAPQTEWPKLYPNVDRAKVKFHRVLTGYLDETLIEHMAVAGATDRTRTLDVVYRAAGKPSPAWGRLGYQKQLLADAVKKIAPQLGLKIDISTDASASFVGDDWIKFLASARYTLGAPSGASLMDRDGTVTRAVEAYIRAHPTAGFEEVEAACFPAVDGNLHLSAIGPRHIEAAATRTCQVLTKGDYNGLLQPDVHYIAVSPDLSNLSTVLESLHDEDRRKRIVERAFDDLIRPMRLTYRNFVREILDVSFGGVAGSDTRSSSPATLQEMRILRRMQAVDRWEWRWAKLFSSSVRKLRNAVFVR